MKREGQSGEVGSAPKGEKRELENLFQEFRKKREQGKEDGVKSLRLEHHLAFAFA